MGISAINKPNIDRNLAVGFSSCSNDLNYQVQGFCEKISKSTNLKAVFGEDSAQYMQYLSKQPEFRNQLNKYFSSYCSSGKGIRDLLKEQNICFGFLKIVSDYKINNLNSATRQKFDTAKKSIWDTRYYYHRQIRRGFLYFI